MSRRLRLPALLAALLLSLPAARLAHADQSNCSGALTRSNLANPVVELRTTLGSVCIEVLADQAPQTAGNFLAYLRNGDIDGTFFHRKVPGFIVQGGGFRISASGELIEDAPAMAPVANEPCTLDQPVPGTPDTLRCSQRGNVRGTIAMAKLGGNPNSATNQWFVNLGDNRANLDNQNGGFTVFARVLGNGMQLFDQIAALPRLPLAPYGLDMDPPSRLGAFTNLPVIQIPPEPQGGIGCFDLDQLVVTFADIGTCAGQANKAGFYIDDACERGVEISDGSDPFGFQVVSGACGTQLPIPDLPWTTNAVDFTPSPSSSGACTGADRFGWGVGENQNGGLSFRGQVHDPSGLTVKVPYSFTCQEILDSNAALADRRAAMMLVTAPSLIYVDHAALSPELVTPAPGATLGTASQTFTWDAHDTVADGWAIWVGATPGGKEYGYQVAATGDATSLSFDALPYQGEELHLTLFWRVNGQWSASNARRFTYRAASLPVPELTSHADHDVLGDHTVTFTWDGHGVPADAWALWFGSSAGGRQHGLVLSEDAHATALEFDRLPYRGETVHATLWWRVHGTWHQRRYTFFAVDLPQPELTAPESASDGDAAIDPATHEAFAGTSATFTWNDHGTPVEDVAIWFGSTAGGLQHGYAWASLVDPANPAGVTSLDFDRLPYAGQTVHVTLYWKVRGRWFNRPYLFTAFDAEMPTLTGPDSDGGGIGSPEPFAGTGATFTWDDGGTPAEDHAIWFGSTLGGLQYGYAWASEVAPEDPASVSQLEFHRLPYQGETVHVTFWWRVHGTWFKRAYTYTAVNQPPALLSPESASDGDAAITSGELLPGPSATFTWDDHGLAVEDHALWFGTTVGGRQYGYAWASLIDPANPAGVTSLTFDRLPYRGEPVHVTFWWKVAGTWRSRAYQYTARDQPPGLTTHGEGSTFDGAAATFAWNDHGVAAGDHAIWFGTTAGGRQYGYAWARDVNPGDPGAVSELGFTGLPTDGSIVHVTFWWNVDGVWNSRRYAMNAFAAGASACSAPGCASEIAAACSGLGNLAARMVCAHNVVRAGVDPPAATAIPDLVWDDDLAQVAADYAGECSFAHNPDRASEYAALGGSGSVGENIAAGTSLSDLHGVVLWAEEAADYGGQPIGSPDITAVVGHYTQIVWANTTAVGCAIVDCSGGIAGADFAGNLLVCDYAPAGNFIGQVPYQPVE